MSNSGFIRKRTLFSPTSIAGCQVWLDAADTATMGFSGTSVNTWTSKGTPSLTATYSGTAPTYTTYNTYPALSFNGSSTKMTTGTIASYGAAGTTWITAAVNLTAVTSSTPVDASAILASAGPPERSIRFDSSLANSCYTIHTSVLRGDVNNNANGVRGFIDTPTSFQSYTNGTNFTTVNTSVTFQTATNTSFILGQWNVGYLNGYIFECVAYDGILTLSQYQQVEGYLATKWGFRNLLPQGHPGVTSVLYPLFSKPLMFPLAYYNLFSPKSIAGCVLWLDGTDPSGIGSPPTNGATVSTWVDKSGSGNNATGGTSPSFTSAGINGLGVVSFNGSSTYLNSQDLYSNRSFSIFFVIRRQASISSQTGLLAGTQFGTNLNLHFVFRNSTDLALGFFANDLDYVSFPTYTGNTATEPAYLIQATYTPGTRLLYVNGNQVASDTNSTNLTSDSGALIGQYNGAFYNGFIGEIIILNGVPAALSRTQIESYLAQKWGLSSQLPANHPNNTTPAGTPALTAQVYGQVQRNSFPLFPTTGTNYTSSTNGIYTVLNFAYPGGTLVVNRSITATYLVVGGGGGGGNSGYAGGGGAGGAVYISTPTVLSPGSYTVTVGVGGALGTNGGNSVFNGTTGTGGGYGSAGGSGGNGGCGGGGEGSSGSGGGTGSQGYNGSAGYTQYVGGGGGGGMGQAGSTSRSNVGNGASYVNGYGGGNGITNSITGSSVYYAGGGGGGGGISVSGGGPGGLGGGGNGAGWYAATQGTNGLGGGGGAGAIGGHGTVIISYLL